MDWCHVTFASSSGAIAAQRVLRQVCPAVVMPVLRQVSAGCGIALRLAPEGWEGAVGPLWVELTGYDAAGAVLDRQTVGDISAVTAF